MNKTAPAAVEDRLMRFLIPFLLLGLTAASGPGEKADRRQR